ncbi:MAG: transglutaminase-like domain-containing protein [Burkholderiaceae bacterium]
MLVAAAIALFGAWVGTSLAVYRNGPVWLVILGAVACFFLVPLAWELWANRHQKGGRIRDAILRSSFLSLTFVVILLATHPKLAFEALATRGDWFLGGSRSALAEDVRRVLHTAADGLEWLNELVREKAFRLDDDDPDAIAARAVTQAIPGTELRWPLAAEVHPAVLAMPDEAKKSIESVGAYLRSEITDPFMRVKAIHDFVATWVAYDAIGLADGSYKEADRQEPRTVFEAKKGVCAGYALLVAAIARVTGDNVVYVVGDARHPSNYETVARDSLPSRGRWTRVERGGDRRPLVSARRHLGRWECERHDLQARVPDRVLVHTAGDHGLIAPTGRAAPPAARRAAEPWRLVAPAFAPSGGVALRPGARGPADADRRGRWRARPAAGEPQAQLGHGGPAPGRRQRTLREDACGDSSNETQVTLRCRIPVDGRIQAFVFAGTRRNNALLRAVVSYLVDGKQR